MVFLSAPKKGIQLFYRSVITLASFLVPVTIHAMTLTEALKVASQEAPELQTLSAETRQAEAIHQQSAQAYLPIISADASWLRADSSLITNVPVPVLAIPPTIQRRDFGPVEGTVAGVQLVQPLFNADAIQLRNAASLKVDARRNAEKWGRQAIRLEVSRRYFNVLREQEQAEAALASHRAAREVSARARASYEQGLASRLDTEQAQAELSATKARLEYVSARVRQAQLELKYLLDIAPAENLRLSTTLPPPSPPVPMKTTLPRQDLSARKKAVEAARADTRASQAEWLPRVNLLARQQWAEGDEPLDADADGWLVAVNLQWTIFDGLGRRGRVAESRAEEQKAKAELEQTRRRIQQDQAIALSRWEASWAGWLAAQEGAEAAQQGARLASRRYEEGIGSMTELLAAQARFDRQRVALIDARYQAVLASMNYHLQNGYDPVLAVEGHLQ